MDGFCKGKYVIDERDDVFKFISQRFAKLKNIFTCFNESLLDKVQHFHSNLILLPHNSNQPLKLPLQLQSAAFDHLKMLMKEPDKIYRSEIIYLKSNTRI